MSSRSYVLHIENFLKVEKATIPLTPGVHGLVGKNAQGKTTIIHALHDLMAGKNDFTKIRDGAERAMVKLEVYEGGELVSTVARVQTPKTMKLEGEGMRPGQTAAGFLQSIMDEVAVNPVTLATSNPVAYLKQHLKVQIEKSDIPEAMQEVINTIQLFGGKQTMVPEQGFALAELIAADVEATRKATGKQVEQERAMVENMKKGLPPEQPALPFDDNALKAEREGIVAQIASANTANVNHKNAQKNLDMAKANVSGMELAMKNLETERANLIAQAERIQAKIESTKQQLDVFQNTTMKQAETDLAANPFVNAYELDVKVQDIDHKLAHVESVKGVQQRFKALFEIEARLKAFEEAYRKQDTVAKFFRYELPKILIAKCKLPVEGIEFRDGEMFVNGRRLDLLSTAEKAIVTTKIAMAVAKMKGHVAITLDGVEYMDEEHRKEFLKAAEDSGMCVIYTRMGSPEYPHEKEVVGGKILQ